MKNFIVDVDGCLTTGQFFYTAKGKMMKVFGPDDNDMLSLLSQKMNIHIVTGDKRGFAITKKRIDDMKFPLDLVSTFKRIEWIEKKFKLEETIYMGDGVFDSLVFERVGYSISPANAFLKTKKMADFVTRSNGGEGAVAEACVHIMEKFFGGFDLKKFNLSKTKGVWSKKN